MRKKFDKLIARYGYKELFFILLYPIFVPLFMLKDTSLSIYNIVKSLLKHEWKYLSGNDQANSYNNLFYYVQDFNIQKFGRYGVSNLLAGGNFNLKNLFNITPFSLRLQSSFGTTFIMFFAMCFWILSWVILYQDNPNIWLILGITFFSTLFFATFIEIQNYNILGWMLYPIFLTYLVTSSYLVLALVIFLIALSSFTAFFIASILVVVSSIYTSDFYLLLTLVAGGIKWIIPIVISMKNDSLSKVFGAIGGHEKVKYSRTMHKKISIQKLYVLGVQLVFVLFFIVLYGLSNSSILLAVIIGLFIINELFIRFADQQSFYLAYLSVSIFCLFGISEIHYNLLIVYALSIYPIYGLMLNVAPRGENFITPGIRKPYNTRRTIDNILNLYKDIPANAKLLVAYKNPEGKYSNLFNGYRVFNEPLQYAATLKNICLFPDWYMVFENNKTNDDESFWIDCENDALTYMKKNNIEYILVPPIYNDNWKVNFNLISSMKFNINENFELNLLEIKKNK